MENKGSTINSDIASSLLRPPLVTASALEEEQHPEEERHRWKMNYVPPFNVPLLRVWDDWSGSQPNDTNCMISRAPRRRLDTFESRKNSLTIHVNHGRWIPTPYISFTTSERAAESLAEFRLGRQRPKQTLTVVNPNVRIKKGLPILDISAEMDHYGVQDPYGMSNRYYKDHFLCIWEVLEDEIVGHWEWEDLAANARWYEEIILPAFKAHDGRMKMKSLDDAILRLSSAMSKTSLVDVSPIARQILRSESDARSENSKYFPEHCFCDSDEEANAAEDVFKHYGEYDSCSDTDDEVEEANAADDSIKFLEDRL